MISCTSTWSGSVTVSSVRGCLSLTTRCLLHILQQRKIFYLLPYFKFTLVEPIVITPFDLIDTLCIYLFSNSVLS